MLRLRHCCRSFSAGNGSSSKIKMGVIIPEIAGVIGGIALIGCTGALGISIAEDFQIYRKCSSEAMEVARNDSRLRSILGEEIQQGQWYQASLASSHEGRTVTCSFPIYGQDESTSAKLRIKAIHSEGINILGTSQWHLLMIEALVSRNEEDDDDVINLMDTTKFGDSKKDSSSSGSSCQSSSVRQV